jgi:4-amino-4-deoxy-L-arabinose transferase-like glycosyltransferase
MVPPSPAGWRGLARVLWGGERTAWILFLASAAVLFVMLGSQTLWTHEGRWALICREMERSGDYFHPRLFDADYFDKPLLSYWFMIAFGRLLGGLNEWTLRIPGALAGLITIACTVRLGRLLGSRETGRIAGWMLAGCFFFVFWSRLACSDMLNVAAVALAVTWYFERRDRPGFATWAGFFTILGLGSLMKGPVAAALAVLAVAPDLASSGRWRIHLRPSLFLGMLPGALAFLLPYALAGAFGPADNGVKGLGALFQENVIRYFHPFDHPDPIYTYAQYLPAYGLPWTLLAPFVIWRAARHWKTLEHSSRWPLLAALAIFVFLTLGAGRRNYYILPILPFLMLAAADWVLAAGPRSPRVSVAAWTAAVSWGAMLLFFSAAVPYATDRGGVRAMALEVRTAAEKQTSWDAWEVELYAVKPQLAFYLDADASPHRARWDDLDALAARIREHPCAILVTRIRCLETVQPLVGPSQIVRERSMLPGSLGEARSDPEALVALIPDLTRAPAASREPAPGGAGSDR